MYDVIVERSAEKDLKKLSSEIRPRAVAAMMALGKNPRPTASRKLVGSENDWRIRIVRINRIRHRKDVYK